MTALSIPSPARGIWYLGPVPVRGYALCIIAGIAVAIWLGERRWRSRGGEPGVVSDVAMWAVPFGLVGGRLYHVLTDPELYFAAGKNPVDALYIWNGGLGIWGAVAFGALGAYIACFRRGIAFRDMADVLAPSVVLAQAIGRWGNWFNQELFGKPTNLPWALRIDPEHRPDGYESFATFHPAFLYESTWNGGVFLLLIWAEKRFGIRNGRLFALYVMAYTAGRAWIEALRIDTVNTLVGLRLNVWTSLILFAVAATYLFFTRRRSGAASTVREE